MTVDARELRSADPEEATLMEIGLKKSFDNGYINLAIFDQSIKGFQSNSFTGTGFNLVNAGQQTHKGAELDTKFALSESLIVQFSVVALDAVYDEFLRGPCDSTGLGGEEYACPPGQSFTNLSGQKPGGVHELNGNANAVYSFNVSDSISGYARLEYVYSDEVQIDSTIPLSIASRSLDNVNASISLKSDKDDFSVSLWGRNLTDHETLLSAFPTTAAPGSFSGYPNAPRTYGITFRKGF
jgi:iron complex outermembrane receptor protein